MANLVVAFQAQAEYEHACRFFRAAGAKIREVKPPPAFHDVAVPYLILPDEARVAMHAAVKGGLIIAGHVEYHAPSPDALADIGPEPRGPEDLVGRMAIAFVGACVAEKDDIRLTAQVEGDIAPAFPYLNAEMRGGTFNPKGPTFTFMDGPRLINLFPHRVTIGRLREMQDAWRTLAKIKRLINDVWTRRGEIEPSYERKVQISALEVYSRLPKTNCGQCGEASCLAFAAKLLAGQQRLDACAPVFTGEYQHLHPPLVDLAAGLGL